MKYFIFIENILAEKLLLLIVFIIICSIYTVEFAQVNCSFDIMLLRFLHLKTRNISQIRLTNLPKVTARY